MQTGLNRRGVIRIVAFLTRRSYGTLKNDLNFSTNQTSLRDEDVKKINAAFASHRDVWLVEIRKTVFYVP